MGSLIIVRQEFLKKMADGGLAVYLKKRKNDVARALCVHFIYKVYTILFLPAALNDSIYVYWVI